MNIANLFAILGTIFSIYLNFSPLILFIQVLKKKEPIDILPQRLLFFQIADRILWGSIWILKNKLIPFINCLICIIIISSFIMVYFYLYYHRAFFNAFIRFLILLGIIYFIFLRIIIYGNISVISSFAMLFSIFIYIAQIKETIKVIKEKDHYLIRIDIAIVGIFCFSSWIIFGKYINYIPQIIINIIGVIISLINTIAWIYLYYKRDKLRNKEEEKVKIVRNKGNQ